MTNLAALPPLSHGNVTVGGKPYCVKFTNATIYLLSTQGIDYNSILVDLNKLFAGNRGIEAMTKLGAASIGQFDAARKFVPLGWSPLELASQLEEGEYAAFTEAVWKVYQEKLGLTRITAEAEPAPSPAQTANPDPTSGAQTGGSTDGPSPQAEPALG